MFQSHAHTGRGEWLDARRCFVVAYLSPSTTLRARAAAAAQSARLWSNVSSRQADQSQRRR